MNVQGSIRLIGIALLCIVGLAACDKGPAQSAGEKIDDTAEDVGEKMDETVDKVEEKLEK